jgi:hypothetical protein
VKRLHLFGTEPSSWTEVTRWRYQLMLEGKLKHVQESSCSVDCDDDDDSLPVYGFKATHFMADLTWAVAALESNHNTKYK